MDSTDTLVRLNGDYCRDICGQENTCGRLKDGKICKDAQRYAILRQYAKTGLSPEDVVALRKERDELKTEVERLRCSGAA